MNYRFYTISSALMFITGLASAANNSAWNCEQTKNGEWTCLNQGPANAPEPPQPAQTVKTAPAEPANPAKPEIVAQPPAAVAPAPLQQSQKPELSKEPVKEAVKVVEKSGTEPQKLRVKVGENQMPEVEKVEPKTQVAAGGSRTQGWTCKAGDAKSGWDCNLVGADPRGEAHIVDENGVADVAGSLWFAPAFSHRQERDFQTLRAEFDRDPWQSCEVWGKRKPKIKATSKEARDAATTEINADFSEVFDGEVLNFAGNVDMNRADQHLVADKASYDTVAETLDAQGGVLYSEDQLAMSSETLSLNMGKDEARLRKAQFIVPQAPFRGSADVVYRDSKSLSRYNEAAFTSCAPGNQDWVVHAARLKINRESGQGSAKNAWLEFKGVPVLYTPYISFPTDNRRLSGFLAPTWGSTQRNGFDASLPFYWNIAPNFDDIVTPRYMSKRGEQIRNKFRYLTDMSRGTFAAEYMPHDQLANKARYSASLKDQTLWLPGLSSLLDLNYVSDKTYFNDLNNALGFQNTSYLPSTGMLTYARTGMYLSAAGYHYQSVDKTITDDLLPYDVLPRIGMNFSHAFDDFPLTLALDNQYSYFSHKTLVNGQRFNVAPSVSFPLESSEGFFIPKISALYSQYQLSNQTVAGLPSSISRTLPVFSVDSGIVFEKDMQISGTPYVNTLEPRLFYLYIPRKDQSNIPIFDTALFDTNFYSLFRENRFSGYDRIQDANQITLAASSRFIDSTTGLEPLKLTLGQILYFEDRTVDLFDRNNPTLRPFAQPQTSSTSNFIGELSGQVSRHLRYTTGAQWDPELNSLSRGQFALKYRMQPNQILNIGYRYRRANPQDVVQTVNQNNTTQVFSQTISQTDVSFRWPLFGEWFGLGRWQYSLNFDKTTESFIGIEKENCCWRFRVLGRRFINGANTIAFVDPSTKPETAFFVQLELKGLSSFGDHVDTFLQTNLDGYRKDNFFE
ncbi:LPS biosynthesis protein [Methylomonas koyamae]|uniref:LPS-assembly protein LptD n=2 Tax=Methylomonas koyamae TaxID=702114 RepID=A0AA91DGC9_9GAMM|nr:LPS biosynthesis protein [Methylomonas koyamae]